jgi:GDP-4-dehydro-6-deoxy-D-mannose reductase
MRALLTGGTGFVGTWLAGHLRDMGDEVAILPEEIDITDVPSVVAHLREAEPEVVYHLAALTHVGRSWESPEETFRVNAVGTLDLLEAVRACVGTARVVIISSAEVYGNGDGSVLSEDAPLRPVNPYAASKVAAEFLGVQAYLGRGLDVVRARPFNHVGPGQADTFVVSALARRIVEAERSGQSEISVGNLEAARDFTDVRDVVRAYRLLALHGAPGGVYNVCSGSATSIFSLLNELIGLAHCSLSTVEDPSLFRPLDVPVLVGDCAALRALTGWHPEIPRASTLEDVLADWRLRLNFENTSSAP